MPKMADWVGGKVLSNLLTHIHIQTQTRPLWLNTPEMCTHFFFLICVELQGSSHFMSVPCHQAAAECFSPSCGSRAGMRATVFADIWEGVYVLMPVWIHTRRLWMELIQAGPPRSACASLAATWVVPQPHHRPDEMSPSDTITHPWTSKKLPNIRRATGMSVARSQRFHSWLKKLGIGKRGKKREAIKQTLK